MKLKGLNKRKLVKEKYSFQVQEQVNYFQIKSSI